MIEAALRLPQGRVFKRNPTPSGSYLWFWNQICFIFEEEFGLVALCLLSFEEETAVGRFRGRILP